MSFTEKDVDYISKLARIYISEEEKKNFTAQLYSILEYVNKLNELDTENVEPTAHILPICNVMREDIPRRFENADYAVKQSPELSEDKLYIVPRVIE